MAEPEEEMPDSQASTSDQTSFAASNSMYETLDLMLNAFNS